MNQISRVLAICGLLSLAACGTSSPQVTSTTSTGAPVQSRLVSTTGEAEVRVVPDEVVLTIGVQTWSKELQVAKADNDGIVKRAIAVANESGIDSKRIQTEYISIEPRYRDSYEATDFIGYFVRKTMVLTLSDLSRFEELLSKLLEAGVTHVHGIDFRTTELRKHRDSARALAVQAAQEKASALAAKLGKKAGDPISIQEEYNGWQSGYWSWWGARYGGASQNVVQNAGGASVQGDSALAPGQISVTARVSVEFELK